MNIECDFSNCVYWDGTQISACDDAIKPISNWDFSKMECSIPDFSTSSIPAFISQIISTSTPNKNFYISNTIDLGQILIIGIFVLAFVFAIAISIKNLIFSQKIKF